MAAPKLSEDEDAQPGPLALALYSVDLSGCTDLLDRAPDLLFLVHAFYQLLLGAVVVFLAALWRHGGRTALRHALIGAILGVLFVHLLCPFYTRAVTYAAGAPLDDPQGAIAFLPAFQAGLYLALRVAAYIAVAWWPFLGGFAVLGLTQTAGLLVLHTLASHSGLTANVPDIRGWAVAGPLLIVARVVNVARVRR